MELADGDATSGKTMDACDTTAGNSARPNVSCSTLRSRGPAAAYPGVPSPTLHGRHCMVGSPQPASRPLTRGYLPPAALAPRGEVAYQRGPNHHLTRTSQRTATARNGMGLESACLRLQPGRLRLQASRSSRRATTRPSPPQISPSKARTSPSAHIGSQPARVRLQPAARTVAGMISGLLRMEFPQDRFMGEEDAAARPQGQACPLGRAPGRLLRLGDIGRYSEI